ncbi:hypothetical protein Gohar_003885 [Gossypium harknessii]|uniref:Uncharacterized protein n=1 Tax=Gossypium harknessii TaxID=34285 RepID=A0A7J9H4K2_9ROSI|nr:hypothetical protein [Gossypium harknessii]
MTTTTTTTTMMGRWWRCERRFVCIKNAGMIGGSMEERPKTRNHLLLIQPKP